MGVISPLLLEAHISEELYPPELPFTILHEKAHLFGFTNEADANFLAFIACMNSSEEYFQYSGYFEVLGYFLYEYRLRHSKDEYNAMYDKLRPEIKSEKDLIRKRYQKHESGINEFLINLYDMYLKANSVKEGTDSYYGVVSLILENNILKF